MNNLFSKIAKIFAIFFAIAFIITLVLSTFLYQLEKNAFTPNTYKEALVEENIYDRLPAVIGDQLVASTGFTPCKDNPVACGVEERSAVLERCLEDALGKEAYQSLAFNERPPTEAEVNRFTPCFDEYGYPEQTENNAIPPIAKNLTAKDWEVFLTTLIPSNELQRLTEESIDQVFSVLNGDAKTATLPLKTITILYS